MKERIVRIEADKIEAFINNNFDKTNLDEDIYECFEALEEYLRKINMVLSNKLVTLVLKYNGLINALLRIVFNKYKSLIVTGNIEKVNDNSVFVKFMEMYCLVNKVEFSLDFNISVNDMEDEFLKEYILDVKSYERLSKEATKELILKAQNGDMQARNKVAEGYLYLVLNVAKKYQNLGLPFPDLIQEGNIGLLKAIENFSFKKDYCFSTYAYTLINKRISRALVKKGKMIKLPEDYHNILLKYIQIVDYYRTNYDCEIEKEELAQKLNISLAELLSFEEVIWNVELHDFAYLQEKFVDEEVDVSEEAIKKIMQSDVREFLASCDIPIKYKKITMLYYGIGQRQGLLLREIAEIFGCTVANVSSLRLRALKDMRLYASQKDLGLYVGNTAGIFKSEVKGTCLKKIKK